MTGISTWTRNRKWQGARVAAIAALVSGTLLSGIASSAGAQEIEYGALDTTFGESGVVATDMGSDFESISDMVVLPDGKIVVVGETWPMTEEMAKFAVARYEADGTLDETFGQDGKVVTNLTGSDEDYSSPTAVVVQPDGKIVVTGSTFDLKVDHDVFATVRYNEDGSLDTTFGKKGKVLTAINTKKGEEYLDYAADIALDADGNILVAGSTYTSNDEGESVVVRYTPKGALDKTFGTGGKALVDLGGNDSADAMALTPDGQIVLAGYGDPNEDAYDVVAGRLNPDGSLDESFGVEGTYWVDVKEGMDWATDVAVRPDGSVIIGGSGQVGEYECLDGESTCPKMGPFVLKLTPDGILDEEWAQGGGVLYEFDETTPAYAMAVREDGMIALTGSLGNTRFITMLFTAEGELDTDFGDGGYEITEWVWTDENGEAVADATAYAAAIQPDGKIVVAGEVIWPSEETEYGNYDFALARYDAPPMDGGDIQQDEEQQEEEEEVEE
ncbi:MAG TPA: hypothetical protein VFR15_16720 [Chloroflexia bacterium]|nr:hypothetical protein [Chloroflexia bacterium]